MLSGAAGSGGALASPAPQKPVTVDPKALPPHLSETLGDLPDSIAELGDKVYPDTYGGLIGVNGGEQVQIYLTVLDPVIEAAFEALAPPGVVSFVQSAQSLRDLEALHQAVLDQTDSLSSQGAVVFSFWPDIATSTEWIGVEDLTPASENAVNEAFGADKVHVFDVPASVYKNTAARMLATRIDDSRPWNAGDSITDHTSGGCSTGYGFRSNSDGNLYTLTAAHCFASGATIWNALCNGSGCHNGGDAQMGTVGSRDLDGGTNSTNGRTDTEVLRFEGGPLIFTGAIGSPTIEGVYGVATNPVGYLVCTDGSYDGQICNLKVSSNNDCVRLEGRTGAGYACHLIHVAKADGSHAAVGGNGDSGGPVYRYIGGKLMATGLISNAVGANIATCPANVISGRFCFDAMYYTAMNSSLGRWNGTLNTEPLSPQAK